jgi:hypothetical protein
MSVQGLLDRICNTPWFIETENYVHSLEDMTAAMWPDRHRRIVIALDALHNNRLTYTHGYHIMALYSLFAMFIPPAASITFWMAAMTFGSFLYMLYVNESLFYAFNMLFIKLCFLWPIVTGNPMNAHTLKDFAWAIVPLTIYTVLNMANAVMFVLVVLSVLVNELRKSAVQRVKVRRE